MVAPSDNSTDPGLKNLSDLTGEGIIVDIGTGDGRFVYQSARQNPKKFYIGIDPNVSPLEKISEKIYRKPAKGGAPNALFIQAAVEDLPAELNGVADELHVHFRGEVCCAPSLPAMSLCFRTYGGSVRQTRCWKSYSDWILRETSLKSNGWNSHRFRSNS
ncbi:MAG TPA: methyltransferase domain-containing protein [Pyrinomonadaceae bacterium]|nr:methyltransferase domain-containing protein [Pyrinomonadaceae bacterium]